HCRQAHRQRRQCGWVFGVLHGLDEGGCRLGGGPGLQARRHRRQAPRQRIQGVWVFGVPHGLVEGGCGVLGFHPRPHPRQPGPPPTPGTASGPVGSLTAWRGVLPAWAAPPASRRAPPADRPCASLSKRYASLVSLMAWTRVSAACAITLAASLASMRAAATER